LFEDFSRAFYRRAYEILGFLSPDHLLFLKEFFEKLRPILQPIEIDMEVEDFFGHRSGDGAHAPFILSLGSLC